MGASLGKPYNSASSGSNSCSDALIHSISDAARADQDNTMIITAASVSSQSSLRQQQEGLHQQEQPLLRPSSQTKHSCVRTTLTTSNSSLHPSPSPRVPGAPLPPALAPIPHSSDGSGGDGRGENFITNSLLHNNCATRVFSASETTPSSVEGKGSSKDPTRKYREKELVRENSAMSKLNNAAAHRSMQTSQEQQEQQTHTKAATSCIEKALVSSSGVSQLTSSGHEKEGGSIRDTSCSAVAAAVVGSKTSAATAYLSEIEKKQKRLQYWDTISTTNAINTYVDSTSSPFPSISNVARLNQETTTNIAANSASSYSSSQQQRQPLHSSKCENDNNEREKTPMMDNKEKNSDSHRDTVSITTAIKCTADSTSSAKVSYPILTGILAYSDRENLRRHIIQGNWKYEHSIDATPQRFELIRIIPPEEDLKEFPRDGGFNGSFNVQNQVMTPEMKMKVKNRAVLENGVMLTFTSKKVKKYHFDDDNSNHAEKYTVFGRGANEFGVFELHGTATKNKVLEEGDDPTYSISVRKVYVIGPTPPTVDTTTGVSVPSVGPVEDKSNSGSKKRNHSAAVGKDDSKPKPPPPTVLATEFQGGLTEKATPANSEPAPVMKPPEQFIPSMYGLQRQSTRIMPKLPSRLEEDDPEAKMGRLMSRCRYILQELIDSDTHEIFTSPVDPVALGIPTYFDVIRDPMDLGTIKTKLENNEIHSPIEFFRLVHLTFDNAIIFNLPTHYVHIQARSFMDVFTKKFGIIDKDERDVCAREQVIDVGLEGYEYKNEDEVKESTDRKSLTLDYSDSTTTPGVLDQETTMNITAASASSHSTSQQQQKQLQQQLPPLHPDKQIPQEQEERQEQKKAATADNVKALVSLSGVSQLSSSTQDGLEGCRRNTSRSAMAAEVVGAKTSAATAYLSEIEKKEREKFLQFTRVLLKYLKQHDPQMYQRAKNQINECYEKNKIGDPMFHSLTFSIEHRLRITVGDVYWKKALDYLNLFIQQKAARQAREISTTTNLNAKASFIISPQITNRMKKRPVCSSKDEQPAKRFSIKSKSMSRAGVAHSTTTSTSTTKPRDVATSVLPFLPAGKAATLPMTITNSSDTDGHDSSDIEDVTEIYLAKRHKELLQTIDDAEEIDNSDQEDATIEQGTTGKKRKRQSWCSSSRPIEILIDEKDMPFRPGFRALSTQHLWDGSSHDSTIDDNGSMQKGRVTVNIIDKESREPLLYRPHWLTEDLILTASSNFRVKGKDSMLKNTGISSVTFEGILANVKHASFFYKTAGEQCSQMASAYLDESPMKNLLPMQKSRTRAARNSYALGIVKGLDNYLKERLRNGEKIRECNLMRVQKDFGKGEANDDIFDFESDGRADTVKHAHEKVNNGKAKTLDHTTERENNAHLALSDHQKRITADFKQAAFDKGMIDSKRIIKQVKKSLRNFVIA